MEIKLINASLMCDPAGNGYTKAMQKVATGGYWELQPGQPNFNQRLLQMTKEHCPDFVFLQIQADGILDYNVINEVSKCTFVIQFSGDIRVGTPHFYYSTAANIHLSLFTNMTDVENIVNAGYKADWLELGVDEEKYRDWGVMHQSPSIVFMANNYGNHAFPLTKYRADCVYKLKQEFGDDFGVYGTGWGEGIASGEFNGSQIREAEQYSSAKVALNISHFDAPKYSSDRLLRALASRCMVISHAYQEIGSVYKVGEHLVTFSDIHDLIKKCRYYLEHEEERRTIAAAGQQHVLNNFTFNHMCENIKNYYLRCKK